MGKIKVGDTAAITKIITEADVIIYAEICGDDNPVHLDEEYAATTMFGKRIAHGTLTGALISGVLGKKLPGPGTIYLSQTYHFKAPVFLNDEVTVKVKVLSYREGKRITKLKTDVFNQDGKMVLEGEAVVIAPEIISE